jgi:hypothetical protein
MNHICTGQAGKDFAEFLHICIWVPTNGKSKIDLRNNSPFQIERLQIDGDK